MLVTTTRGEVKDAFKAILDAAMLGVPVYRDKPNTVPGVVFALVSGGSRSGAIGLQQSPTQRALEVRHRIQINCYHNDKVECDKLAAGVERAIADHEDTLRSTYGIENVGKLDDADVAPENEFANECRVRMDFGFITYRAVS